MTKGFKKNVGAILQFWIDNDGIDVEVSKTGGQFDFVDKKYYKASKIIQYYVFDNIEKNKEHMLFSNIFYIEYK